MNSLERGIQSVPEKEHTKGSRNTLTAPQDKVVCKCTHTASIPMPIYTRPENILPY